MPQTPVGRVRNFLGNIDPRTAVMLGATGVGILLFPPIIGAVGFTSGGVAAGSAAAAWQASIGNVAAGSLFAGLQSVGATGVAAPVIAAGASGVGVAVAKVCGKSPYVLRVADVGAALAFYRVIGFTPAPKESSIILEHNEMDTRIQLVYAPDGPKTTIRLSLGSQTEVDEIAELALASGGEDDGSDTQERPAAYVRRFKDLDGHVLEASAKQTALL